MNLGIPLNDVQQKEMNRHLKGRTCKGRLKYVRMFLKHNKGKLLDIGTGNGIFARMAQELGYDVAACDYKNNNFFPEVKVDDVNLNYDKLPYADNSFDVVLFIEVMEHIYNPAYIFGEINRILKPGGKLLLTTPNLYTLKQRLGFLFRGQFWSMQENPIPGDHVTHIPTHFIKWFLYEYNFKKIYTKYINSFFPYTRIKLPNHKLNSDTVFIVAKK